MSWGGVRVLLTDDELAEARRIGEERNTNKEKRRVQSRKSSAKMSDVEAHVVGVMGELPDRVILSNSRREGRSNTVCCIKRGMAVEIVGFWAPGDEVDVHDFGYGPRDTILFHKLRPLDQVAKHVKECMDR